MKKYILTALILIFTFITGFYIVNFPFGQQAYKLVSGVTLFFTAMVVYYFLIKYIGLKKGLLIIAFLSFYGVVIESIGVSTGFPYGGFEYTSTIGFKIGGLVPWNIFFVWAPLVIGSVVTGEYLFKKPLGIILSSIVILLLFDLIFDPVAVKLGFWIWENPGAYYGIPFSNFIGWVFSGLVSSLFVYLIIRKDRFSREESRNLSFGIISSLLIWSAVSFWQGLYIPLIIGGTLSIFYFIILIYERSSINQKSKIGKSAKI